MAEVAYKVGVSMIIPLNDHQFLEISDEDAENSIHEAETVSFEIGNFECSSFLSLKDI